MLELYQSYGRNQGINRVEAKSNSKKRKEIFIGNFNQLTKYSKQNGFPEIGSMQTLGLDSCKNWVIVLTLFHIGHSQPKLFFKSEIIELFKKGIENGRLKNGSLSTALCEGFRNHKFC